MAGKMPGLPQPYNLRPKRKQGYLTTPMKKLLFYFLALLALSWIIYEAASSTRVETEIKLDTELAQTAKVAKQQKQPPSQADHEMHILPHGEPQMVQQKAVGPDGVGLDADSGMNAKIEVKKPTKELQDIKAGNPAVV